MGKLTRGATPPDHSGRTGVPARGVMAPGRDSLRHTSPGRLTKTDVPVQLRNRRKRAMRGLGYGARMEGGAVDFRLTGLPPVASPLCVECALTFLKGASAPRVSW